MGVHHQNAGIDYDCSCPSRHRLLGRCFPLYQLYQLNTDANANADVDAYANANADVVAYANANANDGEHFFTYANANANDGEHFFTYADADVDADADADASCSRNASADAYLVANDTDANAYTNDSTNVITDFCEPGPFERQLHAVGCCRHGNRRARPPALTWSSFLKHSRRCGSFQEEPCLAALGLLQKGTTPSGIRSGIGALARGTMPRGIGALAKGTMDRIKKLAPLGLLSRGTMPSCVGALA